MISFADLFAGIGGMRLGLENAATKLNMSTQCVLSSEIDPKSRATYSMNFGETPAGDIREIREFPDSNFLLAGFPCQPFSYAGKQRGFGDTRGTLFFEIERFLEEVRPTGFLLENVRGLTTHDGGKTFGTIINSLQSLGYGVAHLLINASSMGVPQNRVRVYILGLLEGLPELSIESDLGAADSHAFRKLLDQPPLPLRDVSRSVVADILESDVSDTYDCSPAFVAALTRHVSGDLERLHGVRLIDYRGGNSIHSWELGLKGTCTPDEVALMNALIKHRRLNKFGSHQDGKRLSASQIETFFPHPRLDFLLESLETKGYIKGVEGKFNPVSGNMSFEVFKFLDPGSVSITLVSSDAHRLGIVDGRRLRRITPREAARLQGFPDSFGLPSEDGVAYFQLGNSVAVPVVEAILEDFFRLNQASFA